MSATSTTRSEARDTIKTFATLRVAGDDLVPAQITSALKVAPTLAYRKGERYVPRPGARPVTGRTGVWYFATDHVVASKLLMDHLTFLARLLVSAPNQAEPIRLLNRLMERKRLRCTVTGFWHGRAGAHKPVVPPSVADFFGKIPARLELDLDADEPANRRVA